MFGEFYKLLIDEPGKITKICLKTIEFIIILMIAEFVYRKLFGIYTIIQPTNIEQWADFILSGRLFFVIACFLFSKYIILSLISGLLLFTTEQLRPITIIRIDRKEQFKWLKRFSVLSFDKESKIPRPGRNFNMLYHFANSFSNEEDAIGIRSLKDSLINEVLTQWLAVIIIYFTLISRQGVSLLIPITLIAVFIYMFVVYLILNNLVDYMNDKHVEMLSVLDFIKYRAVITNELSRYHIRAIRPENPFGREEAFEYKGNKFAFVFPYEVTMKDKRSFTEYSQFADQIKIHYFILVHNDFTYTTVNQPVTSYTTLLIYTDDRDLETKFRAQLQTKLLF